MWVLSFYAFFIWSSTEIKKVSLFLERESDIDNNDYSNENHHLVIKLLSIGTIRWYDKTLYLNNFWPEGMKYVKVSRLSMKQRTKELATNITASHSRQNEILALLALGR